ncbi:MAG TPA: hypothetical protein VGG28_20680 [Kofleriaceae bacterium]|jgi:hypothetical protein
MAGTAAVMLVDEECDAILGELRARGPHGSIGFNAGGQVVFVDSNAGVIDFDWPQARAIPALRLNEFLHAFGTDLKLLDSLRRR